MSWKHNPKITKNTLFNTDIKNIKEVYVTSSNKRYLEVTFLDKRKGDYNTTYIYLREGLKDKGIKTIWKVLKYIDENYTNDLYLKGGFKMKELINNCYGCDSGNIKDISVVEDYPQKVLKCNVCGEEWITK